MFNKRIRAELSKLLPSKEVYTALVITCFSFGLIYFLILRILLGSLHAVIFAEPALWDKFLHYNLSVRDLTRTALSYLKASIVLPFMAVSLQATFRKYGYIIRKTLHFGQNMPRHISVDFTYGFLTMILFFIIVISSFNIGQMEHLFLLTIVIFYPFIIASFIGALIYDFTIKRFYRTRL